MSNDIQQKMDDSYQMGYIAGHQAGLRGCQHCRAIRIVMLSFGLGFVLWMMGTTILQAETRPSCDAMPDGAALLVGSRHVNATMEFQESNPGLFLAFDCGPVTTRIGAYRNSLDEQSWAISWQSDALAVQAYGFQASVFAGLAHYGDAPEVRAMNIGDTGLIPIGGFEFTHDTLPIFAQWTPVPGNTDAAFDHLIAFGLQWDLN